MTAIAQLRDEVQRAAAGGPDPMAALLRAQHSIVEDSFRDVRRGYEAVTSRSKMPELDPGYRQAWDNHYGACLIYDIALHCAETTAPSEWNPDNIMDALLAQAYVVSDLAIGLVRVQSPRSPVPAVTFAKHASAKRTYIAGVHAVCDLTQSKAAQLATAVLQE